MNIIGIGTAGCRLTKQFEKYSQYDLFFVDNPGVQWGAKQTHVESQKTHEDYEKKFKNFKIKKINLDPTMIVLCGASKISGLTLRLIESLKAKKLSVIYIKPNEQDMTKQAKTRHKITFGVLQQYARSGAIEHLHVIHNQKIENILGDISIEKYWDELNEVAFSTFHMLNVFQNTEPLLTTSLRPHQTARISTMGVVNFESLKEKTFYDLDAVRNKKYFFGVNKTTLEKDKNLLHRIRDFSSKQSSDDCDVGFSIYSTDYDSNYVYSMHYTSFVQEQEINF